MNYPSIMGIDVSSQKLDVCLLLDDQVTNPAYFSLDYTAENLEQFLLDQPTVNPEHCLVGMESTGDYHLLAARFFLKAGFKVKILNPILTKQYTRTTIRGTKTDKTDSFLIAKQRNINSTGNGRLFKLFRCPNIYKNIIPSQCFFNSYCFHY